MSIAGEWYSSGTFWTGAGAAATLVVGLATVAVTYLTRFARQRLDYRLGIIAPLLTAPDGVRDHLEVLHRGVRLEQPYLAEVVLTGRGRRDVPQGAFDNGAPIVELLQVTATDSASATPVPPVRIEGTSLLVGPALIGRRQRIVLTCLTENEAPRGVRCEAPLPNARVRRRVTDEDTPRFMLVLLLQIAELPIAFLLGLAFAHFNPGGLSESYSLAHLVRGCRHDKVRPGRGEPPASPRTRLMPTGGRLVRPPGRPRARRTGHRHRSATAAVQRR